MGDEGCVRVVTCASVCVYYSADIHVEVVSVSPQLTAGRSCARIAGVHQHRPLVY